MEQENLETILNQIKENQLSEDDQKTIKEILEKYSLSHSNDVLIKNNQSENGQVVNAVFEDMQLMEGLETVEEGFELPNENDYFDQEDTVVLNEATHEQETIHVEDNLETKLNQIIPKIDDSGQFQLILENPAQMELNLPLPNVESVEVESVENLATQNKKNTEIIIEKIVEDIPKQKVSKNTATMYQDRKEPILNVDQIEDVNAQNVLFIRENIVAPKNNQFRKFENMAQNVMGKFHNMFNFNDKNGKIDWNNQASKTVLLLKNIKNGIVDNNLINRFTSFMSNKYSNSKVGIKTHQIADTITINLMSREDRYNKEFKSTIALLGYEVTELIESTNTPMLTLQEVSNNTNKILNEKLNLELTDTGYTSQFLLNLSDDDKVECIKKIIWPKLTEMISESVKLFEALKEVKEKNPLCKKIAQLAQENNIEESLFSTMLLKNPDILKQKGIQGVEKLLERKEEIETIYFKNEELSGKNFIVMQNLIKASASMQKLILNTQLQKEDKQKILKEMQSTIVKNDGKKYVMFDTIQQSVSSSLKDKDFVKSLRDTNETILKMRSHQQENNKKNKIH